MGGNNWEVAKRVASEGLVVFNLDLGGDYMSEFILLKKKKSIIELYT